MFVDLTSYLIKVRNSIKIDVIEIANTKAISRSKGSMMIQMLAGLVFQGRCFVL